MIVRVPGEDATGGVEQPKEIVVCGGEERGNDWGVMWSGDVVGVQGWLGCEVEVAEEEVVGMLCKDWGEVGEGCGRGAGGVD